MSNLTIQQDNSSTDITVEEAVLDVHQTIQEINIIQTDTGIEIEEVSHDLEIHQAGESAVEVLANAMLIQQFFEGTSIQFHESPDNTLGWFLFAS